MTLCACGCGQATNEGKRYVCWHQMKDKRTALRAGKTNARRRGTDKRNAEIRSRVRRGEPMTDVGRAFAISRQRVEQIIRADQHRARRTAIAAVASGQIQRADACQFCGASGDQLEMHHADYEKPLVVIWLCSPCHALADTTRNRSRKLAVVPDEVLYTSTEAAEYVGLAYKRFRREYRAGNIRSVTRDGRGRRSQLFRAADLDRLKAGIAARSPLHATCHRGHALDPDNRTGTTAFCRACNSINVNGKPASRASQYAVRQALKHLGFTIADAAAGRVVTAEGIRLTAGGASPWHVWDGDRAIGSGRTVADLHPILSRQARAA